MVDVRTGPFANWSARLRVAFFLLLAVAVAATAVTVSGIRDAEASLSLSFERCILETDRGFGLSGFFPVSECLLSRVDEIHLGPGKISISGDAYQDANDVSLHLTRNSPASSVEIVGGDLALGGLTTGLGTLDIRAIADDELSIDFAPLSEAAKARGELSLGDSCYFTARGYGFRIDGAEVPVQPGQEQSATFRPLGGAGHFVDQKGAFGVQVRIVDRALEFSAPTRISTIRFLDARDRCAGVSCGSIRIGSRNAETSVPNNACVRLDAEVLELRHIGMAVGSSELGVDLSGRFRSVKVNQEELVARPTPRAILIGLLFFVLFCAATVAAKRLLETG